MPFLTAAYASLALRLQEDQSALSNQDVVTRLRDSLADHFRGSGSWGSYLDHFGDSESGDVVYSSDGDTFKAPYEISNETGAAKCVIDHDKKTDVAPRTVYDEEQDEGDHMASMVEAAIYTPGPLPLCERFVSKSERSSMDESDFAGKGKSFPINKPEDVMAAVRSIGRAGSGNLGPSGIKARIISIAKRKGWTKYLPKSWQAGEAKASESEHSSGSGSLKLSESIAFPVDIKLSEAFGGDFKSSYNICLIKPGKGSSAFYPAEVLKRDGPKVFKAGTPMRIDHPTRQEEAARPEGSVKDWGAVLEADAFWDDNGKAGAALYGRVKPFSDHVHQIHEKGPYAGVSIRANGDALMESGRIKMQDGVPVLAALTSAEGVDMVTRAGAGGMFLSESATAAPQTTEGVEMTDEQIKLLVSEAIKGATAPLRERALKGDALYAGLKTLEGVAFTDEQKGFVIEEAIRAGVPEKDGQIDAEKFGVLIMAEAQRLGKVLGNGGKVRGLGVAATEAKTTKDCPDCNGDPDCDTCGGSGKVPKTKAKESADPDKDLADQLASVLGLSEAAAGRAAKGRDE
jgi:hypothetical protein